jgi:hypothetical protein
VVNIVYNFPLDFEDVLQLIPMLTVDNDVKTDGKILHLEITKEKVTKPLHLLSISKPKNTVLTTKEKEILICFMR